MSDIVEVRRRVAEHAAAGRGTFSVVGIKMLLAELERLDRDLLTALNENERLRAALDEALEGWAEGAEYKGDYLAKKHGDRERIAELRKLLAKEPAA